MKVFLLLNGAEGSQTGIEDGFLAIKASGGISQLEWIYFQGLVSLHGPRVGWGTILESVRQAQPDVVVIFHVSGVPTLDDFFLALRALPSKPLIVYDEGDMYGGIAKPLTVSAKRAMRHADLVSICGLGRFRKSVLRFNRNVIFNAHNADAARFEEAPHIRPVRRHKLAFVGNRVKPRILPSIRRMSGAIQRERLLRALGNEFPGDFSLYGAGWEGFSGNRGPVDFYGQIELFKETWISVSYDHYPEVPYYFSNRLTMALLGGSIHVCHEHAGYANQFKGADFIYFFKSTRDAIDLIHYLYSLDDERLLEKSKRAREFAIKHFSPEVVWRRFFERVAGARK